MLHSEGFCFKHECFSSPIKEQEPYTAEQNCLILTGLKFWNVFVPPNVLKLSVIQE